MDDFGSGYSSLDLLQEIHFDVIKFDMRFMQQFNQKPESRVILTELMKMAVSLNSETVAEGVETAEQAEFLGDRMYEASGTRFMQFSEELWIIR